MWEGTRASLRKLTAGRRSQVRECGAWGWLLRTLSSQRQWTYHGHQWVTSQSLAILWAPRKEEQVVFILQEALWCLAGPRQEVKTLFHQLRETSTKLHWKYAVFHRKDVNPKDLCGRADWKAMPHWVVWEMCTDVCKWVTEDDLVDGGWMDMY